MQEKVTFSLKIDKDLLYKIRVLSACQGQKIAPLIIAGIKEYVQKHEHLLPKNQ